MLAPEKIFGLIGGSLKNTFSKDYFTKKFEEQNLPCVYQNFELKNIDELLSLIKNNELLSGLNVTIPFKESVIPLLTQLHESAAKIGAVNCIKINRSDDKIELIGYNTDAFGFKTSLQKFIPKHFSSKALILGTGGASKAVQFVCNQLAIEFTLVTSQENKNNIQAINYKNIDNNLMLSHQLIINTTPLGMFPHIDSMPPINYQAISSNHFCFDLLYLPAETQFLKLAQNNGAKVKNGLEMLHEQANSAFDIFTNWNLS